MQKLFYRHATIYTVSGLLTRGFSVVLVPIYTRFLSPRDYGLLDLAIATCNLVNLTIALEIHQAIARYYHEWTPAQRRRYVSTETLFALGVYTAFSVAFLLLAGPVLARLAGAPVEFPLVAATAALVWSSGIFYILQSQLRWSVKVNATVASSILFSVTTAIVTPALLFLHDGGVFDMIVGIVAGNVVGIAYSAWCARENYVPYFSARRLGKLLAFSSPLVLSSVAVFATTYMDRFIILKWLSVDDLGLFSLGTRFASVAGIALVGVNAALTPLIYQHHREAGTREQIEKILEKFVIVSGAIVLGALWFSEEAVRLLATPPFFASAALVPPLVLATLVNGSSQFFPGLPIAKRTRAIGLINVASVAVNFPITVFLVNRIGIQGASLAAVVVACFVAGLYWFLGKADYPVGIERRVLWGTLGVLGVSWAVRGLVPAGVTIPHVAAKTAFCALGLGVLFLLWRHGARAGDRARTA